MDQINGGPQVHEGVLDFRWKNTQLHVELRQDEAAQAFAFKFSGQTAAAGGDSWNVTADLTGPLAVELGSTMLHGVDSFSPSVFSEVATLLETFAGKAAGNAAAHLAAAATAATAGGTPAPGPAAPTVTVTTSPVATPSAPPATQVPADATPAASVPTIPSPTPATPVSTAPADVAPAVTGAPTDATAAIACTPTDPTV